MYTIICSDGTVLYDSSNVENYMATEPRCTLELGQPGNLSFSLLPEHPAYDLVKNMETYLSAYRDSEEIFYGRVIDVKVSKITGLKQIECAGALSFLDDGELAPLNKDGETMTGTAFMQRCINAYNSDIGTDAKRNFTFGTASFSKAGTSSLYQINSYTKVLGAMESYLTNKYGGFLRFRRENGTKYIDWVGPRIVEDPSPIQLTENIIDQDNSISVNDFATRIRPVGKDGLKLSPETIEVQNGLTNKYGRIIKSVTFSGADTEAKLRSEANAYIEIMAKGLGGTVEIKCLDMHYMDGTRPYIGLGVVYTNIAGFEGENMCAAGLELNLANPAEDRVTLKNEHDLNTTSYQSMNQPAKTTGRGGRGGGGGGASGMFQNTWEHITETETTLTFHADLISAHGIRIEETAQEFERYAQTNDAAVERIQGSGVFQNSDAITQVVGNYSVYYYKVPASRLGEGSNPKRAGYYESSRSGIVATQEMVGSGIELFTSIDWDHPGTNGKITATRIDSANIVPGTTYYQFTKTSDETPSSGKNYYTRGLVVNSGSEIIQTEDGEEHNIYSEVVENGEIVGTMLDSALWVKRNDITAAVGEMEVVEGPGGTKTLVIKSGGGLKIERNGTEFGVYDSGNLSAGVLIQKINGQTTLKLSADVIDIDGLVSALTARSITVVGLNAATLTVNQGVYASTFNVGGAGGYNDIRDIFLNEIKLTESDGVYTLKQCRNGVETVVGTFSRATPTTTVTLSGRWSGRYFTVSANPSSGATPSSVSGIVYGHIVPVGGTTIYDSDNKNVKQDFIIYSEDGNGDAGDLLFRETVSISANLAWNAGHTQGGLDAGVVIDTENGEVRREVNTATKAVSISSTASISYNSNTHRYTATGTAKAGSSTIDSNSATSGVEAYADGIAAAGLSIDTEDGEIEIVGAGSLKRVSVSVTTPSITYNSTNHTYTVSATAKAGSTAMDSRTNVSDSQAYTDGVAYGESQFSSLSARPVLSSGGTAYYQAGSSTKYYNAGTSTVVGRGNTVSAREVLNTGGTLFYTTSTGIQVKSYGNREMYYKSGSSYVPAVGGTRTWYYVDSGGTQYYNRANGTRFGAKTTYYKGDGGTQTVQGSEVYVTPVSGTAVLLGSEETLYRKAT